MPDNWSELLPEDDVVFLREKYADARVYRVGNEVHVVLPSFPFPEGYQPRAADLLIRLPPGYSDANPDMFYTKPDVMLASGGWPNACAHKEVPGSGEGVAVYTEPWQRWSRHTPAADWRPGHGLRNYVASIRNELDLKR